MQENLFEQGGSTSAQGQATGKICKKYPGKDSMILPNFNNILTHPIIMIMSMKKIHNFNT
jgi:hypothetical protein